MLQDFFTLALKNIRKRKLRTFLTLLGILLAIATIFVLISLSLGLEMAVQEQFEKLGADKFFIQPRGQLGPPGTAGAVQLTKEDIEVIEKIPGVQEVTYYTIGSAKIEFKDNIRFVMVSGFPLEHSELYLEAFTTEVEDGRFLEEGDTNDVVIGSQYKHNNFIGEEVKVGDTITIQGREFEVQGILESLGSPPDDRIISMPEDEFRELFQIPERIDFIIVHVENQDDINAIADRTERTLLKSRNLKEENQDFTILTPEELLETIGQVLNIITYFLLGISAISLLVGGVNIANTMFTSVLERTREIGVMKAIGAKNNDILTIFLIEAGILGLVGGILGVVLGFAVNKIIEYIAVVQFSVSYLQTSSPAWLILGSLAFSFLAGALSGLWPAWRATQIKPVEALRYE